MAKVTSQICFPASILKFHLGPFNVDGIFEEWVYPTVSSLMDTGASFFSLIPILDEDSINKFMVDVGITIVIRLLKPFPHVLPWIIRRNIGIGDPTHVEIHAEDLAKFRRNVLGEVPHPPV